MYFADPANYFSVACLAFGEMDPASAFPASVIGNLAQRSAEMIYDVQGGKLGFAQGDGSRTPATVTPSPPSNIACRSQASQAPL
nr:unnamed protein product [Digitaria exilis]